MDGTAAPANGVHDPGGSADLGHQVIAVSNGQDGLTVARTTQLDLILLDHKMPELSGLAVLERDSREAPARRRFAR
jgi:CheY-like chemotaxis protein